MLLHWVLGLDKHFRYPHTLHKLNLAICLSKLCLARVDRGVYRECQHVGQA